MKRWCATLLALAVCTAVVHADVTIVQKTTVEGGMMAMAGGAAPTPTMTNRIKGQKARMDIDMQNAPMPMNMSTITDLAAKQVILLQHDQKTVQILNGAAAPATSSTTAANAPAPSVKVDASVTPTGKSQMIDGFKCDEYTFTSTMSMAEASGANIPPEAAAMMKDLTMTMKGSMWVTKDAPGIAEYRAFQKGMVDAQLGGAAMAASGVNMPGMDKMMKAMANVEGMAYLTEATMSIEGSGQLADMMKQMGAMRMTTRVTSIKTEPLSDDLFKIPEGYTKK